MSDSTSTTPPAQPLPLSPPTWEDRLPAGQRSLNRFCENWIFAFIVAMGIRHFVVEPFRIPTASMEPALYGDPALNRSDFVVVDKVFSRFRDVQRFDVTVFQFPVPEVAGRGGAVVPATDGDGHRHDHWLTRPLVYRSFVKRAVVLPGETFYIANGDIFIADADGQFTVAAKPPDVQAAVWESIYRHGAQTAPEWYLPWTASAGAAVNNQREAGLSLTLAEGGQVTFTQPLHNLYVKPGLVRVDAKIASKGPEIVDVALDQPLFRYHDRMGSIWDTDRWWIQRLTTADLDNPSHGALLNVAMREQIGDLRVSFTATGLDGRVACVLSEGSEQTLALDLTADAWRVVRTTATGDQELARGSGAIVGRRMQFATIDDMAVLTIDGEEVHRSAVAAIDPQDHPLTWTWRGVGTITVSELAAERDLHYCANGFLMPERLYVQQPSGRVQNGEMGTRDRLPKLLTQSRVGLGPERMAAATEVRNEREVRSQMLGREVSDHELPRRLGYSPETAITAPDNGYLLLGDNSPMSWDARNWGWVPAANLRGRVVLRIRSKRFGDTYIPFLDWSVVR